MRLENSFILAPGIGRKTEEKLWKNQVTHWDDFPDNDVIRGSRHERVCEFLERSRKNLEVGNTVFFGNKLPKNEHWRLYENFGDDFCFFDIETTGLSPEKNKVTTVSFHRRNEDVTLVRGENLTSERLREEVFNSSALVSFNGKRFDQPFLEKNFDISIEKPHIDLMYLCKRLGLTGGLKQVEKDLGIDRQLEDVDGREAVKLWKRYERKNDESALEKLIRYNQYDSRNLKKLFEIVHNRLNKNFYTCHLPR